MPPSASGAEIRDAYRRLARDHHPDRTASSGGDGRSMRRINEAYRVLSDPARRAVYDASLRDPVATVAASAPGSERRDTGAPEPSWPDLSPARVPWRSLMFFGSLAIIGIIVVAQFTEPPAPPRPDNILRVGDCVVIETNGFARETSCVDDPAIDLVVAALVPFDADCPARTDAHQDRQGMGIACVERPPNSPD